MTTKEKLIHSAIRLFSDKGFEATSTTAICTDAGFSSGALFVHFKTKNDLLDYIYLDIKKHYFEAARNIIRLSDDIFYIFEESMLAGAKYYTSNPENFTFMKRFLNSPHISRITQDEIQYEMRLTTELLQQAKSQKIVIDLKNELIFKMLTWAYYEYIQYCIEKWEEPTKKNIQTILQMIKKN